MKYFKSDEINSTSQSVQFSLEFPAVIELCPNRYIPMLNDSKSTTSCLKTNNAATSAATFSCANLIPGRNYSIFLKNCETNSNQTLDSVFTSKIAIYK